jgi:hypothetical protein
MNFLGVADTSCCFTLADVGANGRENDSIVFRNSSFGNSCTSDDMNVPPMRNIPGVQTQVSHCNL